jgi:hypothetical protein
MTTNQFFNNYNNSNEQTLIDDLLIESIQIYGLDVYYMRRSIGAKDDLLNEDDLPIYDSAKEIEMYIKNVEGFEGQGDFLSKFGLEIRDSITFCVSVTRFKEEFLNVERPNEGDLLYFPLNKKIFKIMHVRARTNFLPAWRSSDV